MKLEKITIVGQFITQNEHKSTQDKAIINTEEIFSFTLKQSGFKIQALMFEKDNESSSNSDYSVFNVRADLCPSKHKDLSLEEVSAYFKQYDVRFIGNIFIESEI